jgi:hypothetical protein
MYYLSLAGNVCVTDIMNSTADVARWNVIDELLGDITTKFNITQSVNHYIAVSMNACVASDVDVRFAINPDIQISRVRSVARSYFNVAALVNDCLCACAVSENEFTCLSVQCDKVALVCFHQDHLMRILEEILSAGIF